VTKKVLPAAVAVVVVVLTGINFYAYPDSPVPIWVSHPIGIVATGYLVIGFVLPAVLGRQRPQDPSPWPPLATGRCGGRVGLVKFSGPLIKVTVYPDRLTLKLFLMGEYTILGTAIRTISQDGWRVVVDHTSPGRISPVRLHGLKGHVIAAILRIERDDQRAARRSRKS
jgi:hypothetical protein